MSCQSGIIFGDDQAMTKVKMLPYLTKHAEFTAIVWHSLAPATMGSAASNHPVSSVMQMYS